MKLLFLQLMTICLGCDSLKWCYDFFSMIIKPVWEMSMFNHLSWSGVWVEAVCHFLQVFDATNTTRERREVILTFAKDNGYKVSEAGELMS